MICTLKKLKVGKSFLYLKIIFFVYSCIFLSDSAFANPCEKVAFSRQIVNSEKAKIKEMEFSHFRRKPRKYIVYQMDFKNRWLRFRESRPDMYNQEAYTAWLMERQKAGAMPDIPYGYRIQERWEPVASFTYQVHHEIVPRTAPSWIRVDQLHDSRFRQDYKDWAESYYLKSRSYPPGYLQYIKNTLDSHFFSGIFTGFKEDRRLKDVMYSLGGIPSTKGGEEGISSTLLRLIGALKGQDRWLDGGTGAGYVLQDALIWMIKERNNNSIRDIPTVLGVTYNRPNPADFDPAVVPKNFAFSSTSYPVQLPDTTKKKYAVWDGRLFQDIPVQELMPEFKLITDIFGIYTYSSDPAFVINKYIRVMGRGGTLGIVYNGNDFVKTRDGMILFREWLESVAGDALSIEYGEGRLRSPGAEKKEGGVAYMLIRKTSGEQVQLPNLTMVNYQDAQRTFRPSADITGAF